MRTCRLRAGERSDLDRTIDFLVKALPKLNFAKVAEISAF